MTSFEIKLLAISTMVIDHIGLFFFPQILAFRVIGRLSFPLFAWLIANGALHTKNINGYLIRILIFAFISQIPFAFANQLINAPVWYFNVLFTLFLSLLAISFIKTDFNWLIKIFAIIVCLFVAFIFNTDYGAFGVFLTILFYIFFNHRKYLILSQFLIFLSPFAFLTYLEFFYKLKLPQDSIFYIEPFALLSLLFINLYNGKQGPKTKYLFYFFYPLQYLVIILFKVFFS